MKAYSLSCKVVQTVFQNNKKCSSYDALNGHTYSKKQKSRLFDRPFLGSHTSNGAEIPFGNM